jgi:spore coat-associated protein N
MKRFRVLFGKRRFMVLLTIAALLLAVGVFAASGASFTAQSATASATFTSGNLALENGKAGTAIVQWNSAHSDAHGFNMRPGDTVTGTVQITNSGNVPGHLYMTKTLGADPGVGGLISLTITNGAASVWTGTLNGAMSNYDTGIVLQPGAGNAVTFTFTATWTNLGTPAGDTADTAAMGQTCTYNFGWSAVANSTIN